MTTDRRIKCLVWDLDGTLWDGTLLEGDEVRLRPGAERVLRELDGRGIVHAIASRNEPGQAWERLRALGVDELFVAAEIGWGSKAVSIERIRDELNLGIESLAFIDDQEVERAEVAFSHPQVLVLDAADVEGVPDMAAFKPPFVTDDARHRRRLYQDDRRRRDAEAAFEGPKEAFLATLGMVFTISEATPDDLQRAEELTVRTHQLNTTGQTYDHDELAALLADDRHLVLMGELSDRFGSYGRIALALVACGADSWDIKLLLASCRVMGRGVGTVLLHHVMQLARDRGLPTRADFRPNGRNEMMLMTYRFAGFREVAREGDLRVLEADRVDIPPPPPHVEVRLLGRARRTLPRDA